MSCKELSSESPRMCPLCVIYVGFLEAAYNDTICIEVCMK